MTQFSTFRLGERLFGVDLTAIREINRNLEITPVPCARKDIRGLINLRGQIVSILDLAVCLGLERPAITEESHNLILKTREELGAAGRHAHADPVGFLVDAIGDVVEARADEIEAPTANVGEAEGRFLSGVVKTDAGLLVLLDLEAVLSQATT